MYFTGKTLFFVSNGPILCQLLCQLYKEWKCDDSQRVAAHSDRNMLLCKEESQITMRGVNPEVDGDRGDAFVGPCDAVCLSLDLLTDLVKVCELFPFAVEEFTPFCQGENEQHWAGIGDRCSVNKQCHCERDKRLWVCVHASMRGCANVCAPTCSGVDKLQNQGPACDNARSTRQKVPEE